MKRILTILVVLALTLGVTAAAESPTGHVRVQLIGNFSMEDTTDQTTGVTKTGLHVIKEDFESKHPGITLEFIIMGWDDYVKKTQTMILANEADVFQVPGISMMSDMDVLEPLQPYIDRDGFDLTQYFDGQVDGWKIMGPNDAEPTIYALPFLGDTRYICYDKTIFDQWGVEHLSEPPTVEAILEKAKAMTGVNPVTGQQNYGVMWRGVDTDDTVVNLAEALGGTWGEGLRFSELTYHFNSPEMVQALEIMQELAACAPEGMMANAGGENFGLLEGNDVAINLRAMPSVLRNAKVLGVDSQYGVSYLFVNEETGKGGMFAGSPFAIGKTSQVKDAAWEFLKYTASDFFQQYVWNHCSSEGLPCVKSALNFQGVAGDEQYQLVLNSMSYLWTPRYPYRSVTPRGSLQSAIQSALNGSMEVQAALDQAQAEAEAWSSEQ